MPRTLTSVAAGTLATAATWHATKAITVVNQGTKTFTVAGDQTADIRTGDSIVVASSTGNNGTYTVVSSTFTTVTAIVVSQSLPSAVADGTLRGQYLPTTGDSIVVNHNVSVAVSVSGLVAISGSGALTVNASRTVDAASCSVASAILLGLLSGVTTRLTITAGTYAIQGSGGLGGNVDIRGGTFDDTDANLDYVWGNGGVIRIYSNVNLLLQTPTSTGTIEVHNATLTMQSFNSGTPTVKLCDKKARFVITSSNTTVSYDGPSGASSMRMGI